MTDDGNGNKRWKRTLKIVMLGDGFKDFLFSPLPGEMIQFDQYFSNGLVQPPTRMGMKTQG